MQRRSGERAGGVGARAAESGQLVAHEGQLRREGARFGLCRGEAGGSLLAFGLAVEAGALAQAHEALQFLALHEGRRVDRLQLVEAIELQVAVGHRAGQHEADRRGFGLAGAGRAQRRLEQRALAAPQVERQTEVEGGPVEAGVAAAEGGWENIVFRQALLRAFGIRGDLQAVVGAAQRGFRAGPLEPGAGQCQRGAGAEGGVDQTVELGVAEALPPGLGGPLSGRGGKAVAGSQLRHGEALLTRREAAGTGTGGQQREQRQQGGEAAGHAGFPG